MANCSVKLTLCDDSFTVCGDYGFRLDDMMSTDVSTLDTLEEFNMAITSELIDAKSRKTSSSYPTLRLLYDRYINAADYCGINSSQFTYSDMMQFSELVGTYWVDLIEQVVPATTIWGSTYVYGNTIFHQQKFQYKKYSLFGCNLPNFGGDVVSPTTGWTSDVEVTWEILENHNYDEVSGSTTGDTFANTNVNMRQNPKTDPRPKDDSCYGVGIIQTNCGSEFVGRIQTMGRGGATGRGEEVNTFNSN